MTINPCSSQVLWILNIMWFFKKDIYRLIDKYGTNKDVLSQLVNYTLAAHPSDITMKGIQDFYEEIIQKKNSLYRQEEDMKSIRKWFRELTKHGIKCLRPDTIYNNPLRHRELIATVTRMEEKKKTAGRPRNEEAIKRVGFLHDELKPSMSLRAIAYDMKKDPRQITLWLKYYREYKAGGGDVIPSLQ